MYGLAQCECRTCVYSSTIVLIFTQTQTHSGLASREQVDTFSWLNVLTFCRHIHLISSALESPYNFPQCTACCCAMQYFISEELTWDIRRQCAQGLFTDRLRIAHTKYQELSQTLSSNLIAWLDAITKSQSAQVYISAPGNKLIRTKHCIC